MKILNSNSLANVEIPEGVDSLIYQINYPDAGNTKIKAMACVPNSVKFELIQNSEFNSLYNNDHSENLFSKSILCKGSFQ